MKLISISFFCCLVVLTPPRSVDCQQQDSVFLVNQAKMEGNINQDEMVESTDYEDLEGKINQEKIEGNVVQDERSVIVQCGNNLKRSIRKICKLKYKSYCASMKNSQELESHLLIENSKSKKNIFV